MEKFPVLFFVCPAPGVQSWVVLQAACRSPSGICSPRRGLMQRLIRVLLLSQAREREGYGSHNCSAGRQRPA